MLSQVFSVLSLGFSTAPSGAVSWAAWVKLHSKSYASPAEETRRKVIWTDTLKSVNDHNLRGGSWTAGLNSFSDLTWEEFKLAHLMTPQNCSATHKSSGFKASKAIPDSIDWREKGALNAIKSQGSCGSCWTFSTTGTLESHHFLKTGEMKNLSEQQLVDCAGNFNNFGCNGGLPSQAFEYISYNGGIDSEKAYSYTAKTGAKCLYDPTAKEATVASVVNITSYDEDELMAAVGTEGPVSIAFQVSSDFRTYVDGVYNGVCDTSPSSVNHAVVAVGYGDEYGLPYFTVRNSWGTSWGMDGYFKIKRGENKCGLADCASYPIV